MDRLNELNRKRHVGHQKLLYLDSKVYKAFLEMEKAAFSNGALGFGFSQINPIFAGNNKR